MASAIYDCSWASPPSNHFHECFQLSEVKEIPVNISDLLQVPALSLQKDIPAPPPPPGSSLSKSSRDKSSECCCVPKETRDLWDTLFKQGHGADVCIVTKDQATIPAHFGVLVIAYPYLYLFFSPIMYLVMFAITTTLVVDHFRNIFWRCKCRQPYLYDQRTCLPESK